MPYENKHLPPTVGLQALRVQMASTERGREDLPEVQIGKVGSEKARKEPRMKSNLSNMAATSKVLKRMFGNLPVRDAKKELRVFAASCDIVGAIQNDPSQCVFAKACQRQFQSSKVFFFRTVAYLDLPQPNGEVVIERFGVSRQMRDLIEEFDKTGLAHPGGFLLTPPIPTRRLDAIRRKARADARRSFKRNERKKQRNAVINGNLLESESQKKWRLAARRYGSGMVHFIQRD